MKRIVLICCLTLGVGGGLLAPFASSAHGDEDHGAAASAPAVTRPTQPEPHAPRIEAASEQFELVGSLQGDRLVIYLDRFATNEPVTGAKIDVEDGAAKASATEKDGLYSIAAKGLAAPGTHALVFTVQAGAGTDLLTGDLVVADPAAPAATSMAAAPGWRSVAGAAAVLLAVLLATAFGVRRFRQQRRTTTAGATP